MSNDNISTDPTDRIEWFDFNGIKVPYVPSEKMTIISQGRSSVRNIPPAYINNLQTYMDTGSIYALKNAVLSMRKEGLLSIVRSSAFKVHGWEAPIAVSNSVPMDSLWPDFKTGRIVLNESLATQKYIDADGDRAVVIFNEERTKCVLVKFPITSHPMILDVMNEEPMEVYHNFTAKMAKAICNEFPVKRFGVNADERELFIKRHKDARTGLLTSAWNNFDIYKSSQMSWEDKNEYIYNSFIDPETGKTQRALDIEDGGMKAVRKEGKNFVEAKVLEFGASQALKHEYAWALTSCSSIGTMRDLQVKWFDTADLDEIMDRVIKLQVEFRKVKPSQQDAEVSTLVEYGLLQRLLDLGLVRYRKFPHMEKGMPDSVMFWLSLPSGEPVALTDVKRDNRPEGLTYAFLLGPVFDNLTLYHEDGSIAMPALRKWVSPITHLQKVLMTFDSSIRAFAGGDIVSYFPTSQEDWEDPKRSTKISMLYKFLTDYCGRYGDPAPAFKKDGKLRPTDIAQSVISRTVVIDYGQEMTEDEMFPIAELAAETCLFSLVGNKGTNRRIRKYMLGNKYGGCCLDPEGLASLHRGGMGRSQLQRALKAIPMRVAIVKMDTDTEIQITPTGVEKQLTTEAFLPQVFNTEEAYQLHLQGHGLTEEDCPADVLDYRTWQNELRRAWTIDARKSMKIGKLIDLVGNKFMPRWHKQAFFKDPQLKDTIEVDLIFPYPELVNKDAHHVYFKDAIEGDLILPDGKSVKCLFIEHTFYRTGSASENVPARWRKCAFKGIDSYPIHWRLNKIQPQPERSYDTTFAKILQNCIAEIKEMLRNEGPVVDTAMLAGDYRNASFRAQEPLEEEC